MPSIDIKYIGEKLAVNINGEYKLISTEETLVNNHSVEFVNEFYKTIEIYNDKVKSDSIIQFVFIGNYIEEYPSIKIAATTFSINRSAVTKCAKGLRNVKSYLTLI